MADKIPPAPPAPAPALDPSIAAIATAFGEAIRANRPESIYAKAGFTPEQEKKLAEPPTPKRWRKVVCKSEETGATFTACVVESASHQHGRIVGMEDYQHPAGITTYKSNGGLVPDNSQILRAGAGAPAPDAVLAKHDCTTWYLQWRWTTFWQADLRHFAGKPLREHMAVDHASFKTPWQDGTVSNLQEVA